MERIMSSLTLDTYKAFILLEIGNLKKQMMMVVFEVSTLDFFFILSNGIVVRINKICVNKFYP
jgi:hypothetical protein